MKIHTLKCGNVNCYAIQTDSGVFLVDTAHPGDQEVLEKQLEILGIYMKDIRMILLTHGHMDHAGTAGSFQGKYNIPVAVHSGGQNSPQLNSRGIIGKIILFFSRKLLQKQPDFQASICLKDNQPLKEYGLDASVISLPGHSEDSAGFLLADGCFFCGDMYMNFLFPSLAHIYENEKKIKSEPHKASEKGDQKNIPGTWKTFFVFLSSVNNYQEAFTMQNEKKLKSFFITFVRRPLGPAGSVIFIFAFILLMIVVPVIITSYLCCTGLTGLIMRIVLAGIMSVLLLSFFISRVRSLKDDMSSIKELLKSVLNLLFVAVITFFVIVWAIIPPLLDIRDGPVTVEAELKAFRHRGRFRRILAIDKKTGKEIELRYIFTETYRSSSAVSKLKKTYRDAKSYQNNIIKRAVNPNGKDKTVIFTVTYYPHTSYRISLENIQLIN